MNTQISYLYRDAHNYKSWNTVVVKGKIRFEDVAAYLHEDMYFIPGQVDLVTLNGYDAEIDHPFHEIGESDFVSTQNEATVDMSAKELVQKFREAHETGWDESPFSQTLRDRIADSGDHLVRIPEALAQPGPVIVRMYSHEHSREDFSCDSIKSAVETILRLYEAAMKLNDGTTRTIGLVINTEENTETRKGSESPNQSERKEGSDS